MGERMLIGISGASCSGKTTVARELGRLLGAPTLHLDRYFIETSQWPMVEGHPSLEQPQQYDGAALLRDARRALCDSWAVVVEGFLLFAYPGFELECGRMVHLDVPHEALVERRLARTAAASAATDVRGGRDPAADAGWLAHGWSEWIRWGAFQAEIPGMQVVRTREHGGDFPSGPDDIAARLVDSWMESEQRAA